MHLIENPKTFKSQKKINVTISLTLTWKKGNIYIKKTFSHQFKHMLSLYMHLYMNFYSSLF